MNDIITLDKLTGDDRKWKDKYKISYCDLCDTFCIVCPDCRNCSCNGSGCEKCSKDFVDFHEVKYHVDDYLNKSEQETNDKIRELKKHIYEALKGGHREIPWKEFKQQGEFSKNDEKYFAEFLK